MNHYAHFMEVSKSNPLVASAIGMGLAGSAVYFLKQTPRNIYNKLMDLSVVNVTFSNTRDEFNYNERGALTDRFLEWVAKQPGLVFSNNYRTKEQWVKSVGTNIELTAGHTKTYFIYNRRLFWYTVNKMDSSGVGYQKMEISVNTFGRNKKVFSDLLNSLQVTTDLDTLSVSVNQNGNWRGRRAPKRELNSVIINEKIKNDIVTKIQTFMESKQFYRDRGIPYKLTILLYGEPGTGKTSLLKALASHFDKDLYWMNLAEMTDHGLRNCLPEVGDNFLVAEDIHATDAIKGNKSKAGVLVPGEFDDLMKVGKIYSHDSKSTAIWYGDARMLLYTNDTMCNLYCPEMQQWKAHDFTIPEVEIRDAVDETSNIGPADILYNFYIWLMENNLKDQIFHMHDTLDFSTKDDTKVSSSSKLTLSGVLNAFDGIVPMDGTVTFFTANRIDDIDPAMMRPGRIDLKYYLGPLKHQEIVAYLKLMYPENQVPNDLHFGKIMGCELANLYIMHHLTHTFEELVQLVYKESNK